MTLTPAWIISLITGFLRLAGEEAAAAYKRRKAAEAARKTERKAEAQRKRLEREAAEQAAEVALAREKYQAECRKLEERQRLLTLAQNEAERRAILVPVDLDPYETISTVDNGSESP